MAIASLPNIRNPIKKRFFYMMQKMGYYLASWKDIKDYIVPVRGQFDSAAPIYGKMIDHTKLIDSHATNANRILGSGLNSGITPKSTRWVRFTFQDEQTLDIPGARDWLDFIQKQFESVLNQTNLYGIFQSTYEELGSFGTGCYILLPDFDSVVRGRSFTAGEYALATDNNGRVNAFARQYYMTVDQVVNEFGLNKCSSIVQAKKQNNQIDESVLIYNLIEKNSDKIEGILDASNKAYRSVYWEATEPNDMFLRESGFDRFPVIAPRWDVTTTDQIYGTGPGWYALGDVKQLQKTHFDKLLAQEKLHNPPMQQSGSVENVDTLPGGLTKTSDNVPDAGIKPAYQIDPKLDSFIELISELRDAIDKAFYVNLFLMIENLDETTQRTATEIAERKQERIMMTGPMIHRLDEEMLTPTIEFIIGEMEDAGMIPPPPPGIDGILEIEYVGVLAQAQKSTGSVSIQKVLEYVLTAMQADPDVLYVFDFKQSVREFAENEGLPSKLIKDEEFVNQMIAQAQKMQQAQMMAQMAESASKTTKNLADSNMDENSALKGLVAPYQQMQGAGK